MSCPVCTLPVERPCQGCYDLFCGDCLKKGFCVECEGLRPSAIDLQYGGIFKECKKYSGKFATIVITPKLDGCCCRCADISKIENVSFSFFKKKRFK